MLFHNLSTFLKYFILPFQFSNYQKMAPLKTSNNNHYSKKEFIALPRIFQY